MLGGKGLSGSPVGLGGPAARGGGRRRRRH